MRVGQVACWTVRLGDLLTGHSVGSMFAAPVFAPTRTVCFAVIALFCGCIDQLELPSLTEKPSCDPGDGMLAPCFPAPGCELTDSDECSQYLQCNHCASAPSGARLVSATLIDEAVRFAAMDSSGDLWTLRPNAVVRHRSDTSWIRWRTELPVDTESLSMSPEANDGWVTGALPSGEEFTTKYVSSDGATNDVDPAPPKGTYLRSIRKSRAGSTVLAFCDLKECWMTIHAPDGEASFEVSIPSVWLWEAWFADDSRIHAVVSTDRPTEVRSRSGDLLGRVESGQWHLAFSTDGQMLHKVSIAGQVARLIGTDLDGTDYLANSHGWTATPSIVAVRPDGSIKWTVFSDYAYEPSTVSPGGWVIVVGTSEEGDGLTMITIRPDGSVTEPTTFASPFPVLPAIVTAVVQADADIIVTGWYDGEECIAWVCENERSKGFALRIKP